MIDLTHYDVLLPKNLASDFYSRRPGFESRPRLIVLTEVLGGIPPVPSGKCRDSSEPPIQRVRKYL
jgi:hypothetical protein